MSVVDTHFGDGCDDGAFGIQEVLSRLQGVTGPSPAANGSEVIRYRALCPAHDDRSPSLSVGVRPDGDVIFRCFAGCSQAAVRRAIGMPELGRGWQTYEYVDADGELLFQVIRKPGKKFVQRRPDPSAADGWSWSTRGLPAEQREVPFMLPMVLGTVREGGVIYVVEGEKDVLNGWAEGVAATCNAGGAGRWTARHAGYLRGADVVVVADKDEAGYRHAARVRDSLKGVAASVRVVQAVEGKDLSDHLAAGHGLDELVEVTDDVVVPSGPPQAGSGNGSQDAPLDADPFSDSSLAESLAESVAGRWVFVVGAGWCEWDGRLWRPRARIEFIEVARQFLARMAGSMLATFDRDVIKRAPQMLTRKKIADVADLAQGVGVVRTLSDFDTDPNILVAGNGVIDLRSGELLPHDPNRLVMKGTDVDFVPGATHEDWGTALEALPDVDTAQWMQLRFGQALTGYVPPEDELVVLRGSGRNGKSTFLGAILKVGGDQAVTVSDKLLQSRGDAHPTEKMMLRGARIAVQEETREGRHLDVMTLKGILGTPEVTARYMRQDNVSFKSTWALFLSTNYELTVTEMDDGTWRRLLEVPFPWTYINPSKGTPSLPHERAGDPQLRSRLIEGVEQQRAVLAWLVEGARRWHEAGRQFPVAPTAVLCATERWRRNTDHWRAYSDECLEVTGDPMDVVWVRDAFSGFSEWLRSAGHAPWSETVFRSRVAASVVDEPGVELTGPIRWGALSVTRPVVRGLRLSASLPNQGRFVRGVRFVGGIVEQSADAMAATTTRSSIVPPSPVSSLSVSDFDPGAGAVS